MPKKVHDVIIVGGGPAGLFAAYHLAEQASLDVLLIEKGRDSITRNCPMTGEQDCIHCKPCNILSGMGGAGLFSDGKLNFIPKLGKTDLTQFMSLGKATALIDETEGIFNRFGMDGKVYPTNIEEARSIRKEARKFGIDLLVIKQKHLGSDNLPGHITGMVEYIKSKGVTVRTKEEVIDILLEDGRVRGVTTATDEYLADNVILAPGRVGAEWVGQLVQRHGLAVTQRGIEVGVRVEVHNEIMQDLCSII